MDINPPLLNSANPWATTLDDLRELFECPHTGAVTTRTALLDGFPHDAEKHRFVLFDGKGFGGVSVSSERERVMDVPNGDGDGDEGMRMNASLNTLGYSYYTLDEYLGFIERIVGEARGKTEEEEEKKKKKWFIVSVTGSPRDVTECYRRIAKTQEKLQDRGRVGAGVEVELAMEVNLSCPNIPNKPPPAYSGDALREYISAVSEVMMADGKGVDIPWGVKTPPYTFAGQFEQLMSALRVESEEKGQAKKSVLTFVTATNTLGSCLILSPPSSGEAGEEVGGRHTPALPGYGIGGMAGAPLHPLALGNVATLRRMLDEHPSTRHIGVIGIGGVEDAAGYRRMRDVGAFAVGVGTALGARGVKVFGEIEGELGGNW